MYSKNLLFLFFTHSFLWAIFINNLFEYSFSKKLLIILWLVFFIYIILKKKYLYYLAIIILWGILGIYISQNSLNNIKVKNNFINNHHNQKNDYILEIKELTKKQVWKNQYSAKILDISNIKTPNELFILINIPSTYKLSIWDKITTNSKLYQFKNTSDFQYKEFMNSKNIYASMNIYSFENIWHTSQNKIKIYAQNIRKNFLDIIYKIYPKNEAIFLWGILLWARESLSDEIKEDFNNSWLTHFIAVSWFNITILIIFIWFLVKYFPSLIQIIVIWGFIIFFVLIVWDTAPVIRAAIMWLLWYIVLLSGRKWHWYTLLIFTAWVMVLISPYSINYDISLHLSFLAVLWIIFTQDFYKKIFHKVTETLAIKEALVLTFAALTFTLPLMLFNFWQVSILSPFANISVTWTIPIAMLLGFISIIVYLVSPLFWEIIWYLTWLLLKFDMLVVDFFWNLEFSVFKYDFWIYRTEFLILYFLISIFLLLYFNTNKKEES